MSTEEKKSEALSGAEMSGIAGGDGRGSSKDGSAGGGMYIVGSKGDKLSEAEMSGIAAGRSKDGSSGGAMDFVDPDKCRP